MSASGHRLGGGPRTGRESQRARGPAGTTAPVGDSCAKSGAPETLAAIEAIGLDGGKTRAFHLRSEQVTEERTVDPVTGAVSTRQLVRPFEMSIPLLALLPISTVQIQEMNVDFTVEIVDIREQQIGTPSLPAAVSGPSLSGSLSLFSSASPQGPAMKVQMRLVRDRPEGLARVGDILTDLLGGRGQTGRPVDDIPGMPPEV